MAHTTVCKLQVRFSQACITMLMKIFLKRLFCELLFIFCRRVLFRSESKESYIRQELILSTIILVKLKKKEQTKHNLLNDYFIKY